MRIHPPVRLARVLLAALLLVPLVGLPAGAASAAGVSIGWTRRAGGLDQPTGVTSARDGTGRLFVVEKTGRLKAYRNGRLSTYLDLRSRLNTAGEGGLLSVAFDPDFRRRPFLWVTYTRRDGGALRVERFRAATFSAPRVPTSSGRPVLDVPHPRDHSNHWGGQLAFGPDRFLYLSTGDGGDGGARARDLDYLGGKILRIDARRSCGASSYCVPATNPFAAQAGARRVVWASGLRNPWRFSIDPRTGDLWIADVGESTWEEVTRLRSGVAGANLGWNACEAWAAAGSRTEPCSLAGQPGYVGPRFWYSHSYGSAITGGFVYRGAKYRSILAGRYVGGDFVSGRVFTFFGGRSTVGRLPGVTSFGEGATGELWAVTLAGGLYRMAARRA